MSPLWLIPGLVVLLGTALVLALLRAAADEARLLAEEVGRQREVAHAVRRLGDALRATSEALPARR